MAQGHVCHEGVGLGEVPVESNTHHWLVGVHVALYLFALMLLDGCRISPDTAGTIYIYFPRAGISSSLSSIPRRPPIE